jgi:hypothetical protein
MKIFNFDGKKINWRLDGYRIGHVPENLCSQYHLRCRQLLIELFPLEIILEEVPIPQTSLTLDFYVPNKKLAIEVDGKQHREYTPFFHHDKRGFAHAQSNDKLKNNWCELNNIQIIRLSYDKENEWKSQLTNQ